MDDLSAAESLPRHERGVKKDWWTPELTRLRDKSIAIHELWKTEGRPRQGPTHVERLQVRAAYKKALRLAKNGPKQASWNRLHTAMEQKDTTSFWKWWKTIYSKNNSKFAPVVEGCNTRQDIADVFQKTFEKNSRPNNEERVEEIKNDFAASYPEYVERHKDNCDCDSYTVNLAQVIDAMCNMKSGKSADDDDIQAEHLLHAPSNLLIRITALFNSMLSHAFVPQQFRYGTIIPIVKDTQGNNADSGNYRGITISPIPSKLFEHVLKIAFGDHLVTSSYQFGFKSKSSTSHGLFCLKETINYYIDHGSRVFCSFMDASKAFDRLVHRGLFLKLMAKEVPLPLLDIIISWYDGLQCRVKWDGCFSQWFSVTAGVRKGGVLSPDFYSIYVDDLISILKSSGVGCHV